jgi:exodeoxyribonuclease V beta subunit
VALQKYLKQRIHHYDYEKHFGGIFYVFLRGVDKKIPESGVFYDFPNKDLIAEMENILS